jgi:hypothetical protein
MALVVTEPPKPEKPRLITASAPEVEENFEEFEEPPMSDPLVPDQPVSDVFASPEDAPMQEVEVVTDANDLDAGQTSVELADISSPIAAGADLLATTGIRGGTAAGFGGRTSSAFRSDVLRSGLGGLAEQYQKVVEANTEFSIEYCWNHQLANDGSWTFDYKGNPSCQGQCDNPKHKSHLNDRVAATALALWPQLMKGYIHKGPIDPKLGPEQRKRVEETRQRIERGLAFLAANVIQGKGKAFHAGGNMYSQALTAAVLCEAFAMSQDSRLQVPAQMAIDYIMEAQDPVGGGWRYTPKQPGDTSAVAWQLVALKSANLAYLRVHPPVIKKAVMFLDSVQSDGGAAYGYTDSSTPRPALNGAGLLCRIFTGWKSDNDALLSGARKLAKAGPNNDMYYCYYATQVLYHLQKQLPDDWMSWQKAMLKKLDDAIVKEGHLKGSYYKGFEAGHAAEVGGRLYVTSMATMTMEVYFGKGVIYQKEMANSDDFVE